MRSGWGEKERRDGKGGERRGTRADHLGFVLFCFVWILKTMDMLEADMKVTVGRRKVPVKLTFLYRD